MEFTKDNIDNNFNIGDSIWIIESNSEDGNEYISFAKASYDGHASYDYGVASFYITNSRGYGLVEDDIIEYAFAKPLWSSTVMVFKTYTEARDSYLNLLKDTAMEEIKRIEKGLEDDLSIHKEWEKENKFLREHNLNELLGD